jgi:heme/copper-type cytochrome/quinol oxidase subunit 2
LSEISVILLGITALITILIWNTRKPIIIKILFTIGWIIGIITIVSILFIWGFERGHRRNQIPPEKEVDTLKITANNKHGCFGTKYLILKDWTFRTKNNMLINNITPNKKK